MATVRARYRTTVNRNDFQEFNDFLNNLDNSYDLTGTQIRIHKAAVNNFEYLTNIGTSEEFLRSQVGSKLDMSTLFVDLVGSTHLSRVLPERTLTVLMTSFAHEMAYLIEAFGGYTLKFVGDAVIGYFVGGDSAGRAAQCSMGMLYKTEYALNGMFSDLKREEVTRFLDKLDPRTITDEQVNLLKDMLSFKNFAVRVGLNYGTNTVVRYGRANQDSSTVDLIGYPLNLTAKIQMYACPNEVLAGEHLYNALPSSMQGKFVAKPSDGWNYCHPGTDNAYNLYSLSV